MLQTTLEDGSSIKTQDILRGLIMEKLKIWTLSGIKRGGLLIDNLVRSSVREGPSIGVHTYLSLDRTFCHRMSNIALWCGWSCYTELLLPHTFR